MKKGWFIKGVLGIGWSVFPFAVAYTNPEGGYLNYNNPTANPAPATLTSVSYIFSLLITFAIVVGLAYFTSKFLSRKLSPALHAKNMIVHDTVSLGVNKLVYLVEVGGKVLLLGVTDHNITCLQEFTDEQFMLELHSKALNGAQIQTPPAFNNVFAHQIEKLQRMTSRFAGQREEE